MSWDRTNDFDEMFSLFRDQANHNLFRFGPGLPSWKLSQEVRALIIERLIPRVRSTDTVYTLLWYGHRGYPKLSFTNRLGLKLKRVGRWLT